MKHSADPVKDALRQLRCGEILDIMGEETVDEVGFGGLLSSSLFPMGPSTE